MAAKTKKFEIFADQTTLDWAAVSQMEEAMKFDWAVKGALMPDTHKGYALPIGAVVLTEGAVVPSWPGFDLGCGVSASILANIRKDELTIEKLEQLKDLILKFVPVGNARFKNGKGHGNGINANLLTNRGKAVFAKRANGQLGTLGGGNHFIEIGYDNEDRVAITIHSGSRGFGHGIATEYMKLACDVNRGGKNTEGSYPLMSDTQLAKDYINDALIAQEYALMNRQIMSDIVADCISEVLNKAVIVRQFINRNHNHVDVLDDNKFIHRKGATHADKDMLGVIPGNMRDGCFIVVGKGNPDYLNSCSHGAGRVLSRAQAKKVITLEMMQKDMEGIVGCISEHTIDEAPAAYKNIFDVMKMQGDSVQVINYLKPILNIKG